jgi:hypothetical protein
MISQYAGNTRSHCDLPAGWQAGRSEAISQTPAVPFRLLRRYAPRNDKQHPMLFWNPTTCTTDDHGYFWAVLYWGHSAARKWYANFPGDSWKELFTMRDMGKKKRSREKTTLELFNSSLRHAEGILVRMVLEEMDWNISRAARELHIPRGTLYSKMQKHAIQRPTWSNSLNSWHKTKAEQAASWTRHERFPFGGVLCYWHGTNFA